MFFRILMVLALCFGSYPAFAQDMSVEEAYAAIPHKQTTYEQSYSHLTEEDSKYLDHFFFVADIGVRARVLMLRKFYGQKPNMSLKEYDAEIDNALLSFSMIPTPKHLQKAEDLLMSAILDQKAFFHEWAQSYKTPKFEQLKSNYAQHPKVQNSHAKLIQAYNYLKQKYPLESEHNITAFFDHLCALDFI